MKKISLVVLLGLVLTAVFTGCNQSDNTPTPPATNSMPSTPSTNK